MNMKKSHFGFSKTIHRSIVIALLWFGHIAPAHAYLDPGTGSIILQGLIAGFMVVSAAASVFWQRIKSIVSSLFSSGESTETERDDDSD